MYFFQPGQNFICHLQSLPINDLGALSYFARIEQASQRYCAINLSFPYIYSKDFNLLFNFSTYRFSASVTTWM